MKQTKTTDKEMSCTETMERRVRESIERVRNPSARGVEESVIRELAAITRDGFGSDMAYDDAKHHILSGDVLHLFRREGRLAGFASYNSYEFAGKRLLYFSGVVVRRRYQGNGFCSFSMESELGLTSPAYMVMRTQSAVMYSIATRYGTTFPSLEEPNRDAMEVGSFIAGKLGMRSYDPAEFVERGTYGKSLYTDIPVSGDGAANGLFATKLRIDHLRWRRCDRGDGDIRGIAS